MKRFRFTLTAICLVLLWLGWTDTSLFLRNRTPETITAAELVKNGPPREWLHITGGYQDLLMGISMSGNIELDSFLIPLRVSPESGQPIEILVETRDPLVLQRLKDYYFKFDTEQGKQAYLKEHQADFFGPRDITGMVVGGLIATGNKDKLMKLAKDEGLDVSDKVLFISEGKEPSSVRGFIFLALGLLGLFKVLARWKKIDNTPSSLTDGEP